MGRRKISIAPIVDDRNRSVTFLKRKNGLFKKAFELGILCSAEVAVIVFSNTGKLFEFSSTDMDTLLLRYSHFSGPQHEKRGPDDFMSKDVDAIRKKGLGGKMTSLSDREGGNDSNDEENEEGDEDEADEDEGEQLIGNWGTGLGGGDGSSEDDDEVTKPKKGGKRGKAPPKKSAKKSKGGNNKMTDSSANNSPPHSHNAGPSPPLSVHSLPLPTHHFPPGISPFYQSQSQPSVNPYYSSIPPNGSTSNGSGGSNTPGATFSPSWNGYSAASLGGGPTSNGSRPHPLAGMAQPGTPQQAQLHAQQQQQHPAGQWVLAPHANSQQPQSQQQQHGQPHWTQGPSSTTSSSSNSIKASSNLASSSSAPNTSSAYGVSSIPAGAELAALHAAYQQSQLVPGQNQALGPSYYAGYQQQQQQQAAAHVAAQQHLQQQQQQQLHHQQQQQQAHQQQQQAQAQHQAQQQQQQQQAQAQQQQQQQHQQQNQLQHQQLQSQAHQHQLQQQQQQHHQQQQFLQHQAQLHHHQQQRELQRSLSGSELGRPASVTSLRSENGTLSRANSQLNKPRLSVSIPGGNSGPGTGAGNEEEDVKLLMTEEPDRMEEGDDLDEEEQDHSLDPGFTPSTNSRYAADLLPSPSGFLNDHLYSGYSLSGLNTAIAMSNEESRGSIFSWPTKSDRTTSSALVANKVGESIVEESPTSASGGIVEREEGGEGSSTPSGPAPALNERDAPDLYGSGGPSDDEDQGEVVDEQEEVITSGGGRDTRFRQLKKRGNEELPRSPVTAAALEERGSDQEEGEDDEYIKKARTRLN